MNIQKISNAQILILPSAKRADSNNRFAFNARLNAPLSADTISFQGRASKVISQEVKAAMARQQARVLRDLRLAEEAKAAAEKTAPTKKNLDGAERARGISKSTSQKIKEIIEKPQAQVHEFMERAFGDFKVSELSPKNLILDMSDRAKTVISIMEKSATRDWNSIKEILLKMSDLNGGKIVMNYKTGKKQTEDVLDRLIPLIKTGQITLKEIELQRPSAIKKLGKKEQEAYDYVSKEFLDKLEDAQETVINGLETDVDKIQLIERPLPKYTRFNYCALHLLLQLNEKGSRPFELQIMGAREAAGKVFDDKRFKYFDGKELDKKYTDLIELWEPLKSDENKAAKEEFFRYCQDANMQLREDELREFETQKTINRPTGLFRTVREYNLTPEYDLNAQYKIMQKCDSKKTPKKEEYQQSVITEVREEIKEIKEEIKEIKEVKAELKNEIKKATENLIPISALNKLLEKFGSNQKRNNKSKIKP